MQRGEIGYSVDAQDDSLAIEDKLLAAVPQRCLGDPGKRFVQS
jgi:hypothetical protein